MGRKNLKARDKPLSESEKLKFFDPVSDAHLNYRYTMLWTHTRRANEKPPPDYCFAVCAYESGLIACRVFMEFLGLGIRSGPDPQLIVDRNYWSSDKKTTDEVKVTDLGGRFVDLSQITREEQQVLAKVYHLAQKASAHLTCGARYMSPPDILCKAVPIIDRLLRGNLYEVVGKDPWCHGK